MHQLPVETLSRLSHFLDADSLFYLAFLTCKRLSQHLQSARGVRGFKYSLKSGGKDSNPSWAMYRTFPRFLARLQGLEELCIKKVRLQPLSSPLVWPKHLQRLTVPNCNAFIIYNGSEERYPSMSDMFPSLMELSVLSFGISPSENAVAWMSSMPPTLKSLHIGQTKSRPDTLRKALDALPPHCQLESFSSDDSFFIPSHAAETLESLTLCYNQECRFSPAWSSLKVLKKLTLKRDHSDNSYVPWDRVPLLPQLTYLNVDLLQISEAGHLQLPSTLTYLKAIFDPIHSRVHWKLLPRSLAKLSIGANSYANYDDLPDSITNLALRCTGTEDITRLPSRLTRLNLDQGGDLTLENVKMLPETLTALAGCVTEFPTSGLALLPQGIQHLKLWHSQSWSDTDVSFLPRGLRTLMVCFLGHLKGPNMHKHCLSDAIAPLLPPTLEVFDIDRPLLVTGAYLPRDTRELQDIQLLATLLDALPHPLSTRLRRNPKLFESFNESKLGDLEIIFALWNVPATVTHLRLNRFSRVVFDALPIAQAKELVINHPITDMPVDLYMAKFAASKLESLHLPRAPAQINSSSLAALSPSLTKLCLPSTEILLGKAVKWPSGLTALTIKSMDPKVAGKLLRDLSQLIFFHFIHASKLHTAHISALPRTLRHLRIGREPTCPTCLGSADEQVLALEKAVLLPPAMLAALPPSLDILEMATAFGISSDQLENTAVTKITAAFVVASTDLLDFDGLKALRFPDMLPSLITTRFPLINIIAAVWTLQLRDQSTADLPSDLACLHLDDACPDLTAHFYATLPQTLVTLELPAATNIPPPIISNFPASLTRLRISCQSFKSSLLKGLPGTMAHLHLTGASGAFTDFSSEGPGQLLTLLIDDPASITNNFIARLPRTLKVLRLGNCSEVKLEPLEKDLPPSLVYLSLHACSARILPFEVKYEGVAIRMQKFNEIQDGALQAASTFYAEDDAKYI